MAVSTRACGICSGELRDFGAVVSASEEAQQGAQGQAGQARAWGAESTVQLECKHCFHDQCIRGWTIVGKKVYLRRSPQCSRIFHILYESASKTGFSTWKLDFDFLSQSWWHSAEGQTVPLLMGCMHPWCSDQPPAV